MSKKKSNWSGGLAEWMEGETVFISIAFSWKLTYVYQKAVWYRSMGYNVRVGGPGTFARKKFLSAVAEVGGDIPDAVTRHNKDATFASRGCPVDCYFCIVPKMEGKEFTLLPEFTPRPILCDNNLSALPDEYQEYIIDKYKKSGVELNDASSGFEPRTFTKETYLRWKEINKGPWRFAYDETSEGDDVHKMARILKDIHHVKKRVYILIGNEPFDECMERIKKVIEWGCEPHVQPMIPLRSLEKKPLVRFDWTERKLKAVARWANRWLWRSMPFEDYKYQ